MQLGTRSRDRSSDTDLPQARYVSRPRAILRHLHTFLVGLVRPDEVSAVGICDHGADRLRIGRGHR